MFDDAFTKLDKPQAAEVLSELAPHLQGGTFSGDAAVLTHPLPFYPGYALAEVADHGSVPPRKVYAVYKSKDVTVLDWTNVPIYALNARVPIRLDKDTAAPYVRFFFSYVRGRHGRFQIVENVDDIDWKEDPPPSARKAIAKMVVPLQAAKDPKGGFTLKARMMFRGSLFESTVGISSAGAVSMSDEELLVEDMPVLDDTLGQ